MTKTTARRRRHSFSGSAVDSIFTLSESVALLEQSAETNQRHIDQLGEQTNRSITELAQATNRQIRELTNVFEKSSVETRSEIKALATAYTASQKPELSTLVQRHRCPVCHDRCSYVDHQPQH